VIEERRLAVVGTWLDGQRALWEARTDRLEQFVVNQEKEKSK